jgi:hypothetical protein
VVLKMRAIYLLIINRVYIHLPFGYKENQGIDIGTLTLVLLKNLKKIKELDKELLVLC